MVPLSPSSTVELNHVVVGDHLAVRLMIIPVPSSSLPCDLTSIETTAGITLLTSSGMVTLPLSTAAPGVAPLSLTVRPVFELLLSCRPGR